MDLLLLQFNNYYNRQLKIKASLANYPAYTYIISNLSFNPNDGVDTVQIVNQAYPDVDYALLVDDNDEIVSRWFIMECERTRNGQYRMRLHRDVCADYWTHILNADCLIDKATLSEESPFIYNKEPFTTNQIKQSEYLLKDETRCAWIVGYINRDTAGGSAQPTQISFTCEYVADYIIPQLSDYTYYAYRNKVYRTSITDTTYPSYLAFVKIVQAIGGNKYYKFERTIQNGVYAPTTITEFSSELDFLADKDNKSYVTVTRHYTTANLIAQRVKTIWDRATDATLKDNKRLPVTNIALYDTEIYNHIQEESGKIINTNTDDSWYQVSDTYKMGDRTYEFYDWYYDISDNYQALSTYFDMITVVRGADPDAQVTVSSGWTSFLAYKEIPVKKLTITQQLSETGTFSMDFPTKTNRYNLKDAPYDMFCIPVDRTVKNLYGGQEQFSFDINRTLALNIAQGIAAGLGSAYVLDVQLLPYCPMTGFNITENYIDINIDTANTKRYTYVKQGNVNRAIILWSTSSTFHKQINFYERPTSYKIDNQTRIHKLVAPNYSAQYEFNMSRNRGLYGFNVDCTYLPVQPYIHIQPIFSGLYGQTLNGTATGLICGGDFSISYNSDAWINYQVQNKNYANIFDRQMQNLDTNYYLDRTEAEANMVLNTVSSMIGGAGSGGMAKGAAGAIVGGAAGLMTGIGGGLADLALMDARYTANKSYAQAMHIYELQNIKALPYSLTKCTAINENNKLFPFLEIYDCTPEEKRALANAIRYGGMTLGVIDKINNYISNTWAYNGVLDKGFIKGTLIQMNDVFDDEHIFRAINVELQQGVYTK